jgi:hypothetical protein
METFKGSEFSDFFQDWRLLLEDLAMGRYALKLANAINYRS